MFMKKSSIKKMNSLNSNSTNSNGEKEPLKKTFFKQMSLSQKEKINDTIILDGLSSTHNEHHFQTQKSLNSLQKKKTPIEGLKSRKSMILRKKSLNTNLVNKQYEDIQEENYTLHQENDSNNINNGKNDQSLSPLQTTIFENNRNNIRVYARVRPVNEVEQELLDNKVGIICVSHVTEKQNQDTLIVKNSLTNGGNTFNFDQAFSSDTSQKTIYDSVGKNIVFDVLSGYNGTIFAYGQSGSGKTHTMYGHDIYNEETKGIIPRLISDIFEHVNKSGENVTFQFTMSILQIYKEVLFDLITGEKDLKIKENPIKGIYVDKLTEVYINSIESFMSYIDLANENRFVSETKLNSTSSRSHTILIFEITQTFINESFTKKGTLNLVDLAGSEKISKTGASGEALEEAKKINLSLSSLGHVIYSLTSGSEHIPYRDSKLTRILQESLGGNFKTSLIVTCSPHSYHFEETLSTFQFAQRAKNMKNAVKINIKLSYDELQKIVTKLKVSLEKSEKKLAYFKKLVPKSAYIDHNITIEKDSPDKTKEVSLNEYLRNIDKNLTLKLMNNPLFTDDINQDAFSPIKENIINIDKDTFSNKDNILIVECDEVNYTKPRENQSEYEDLVKEKFSLNCKDCKETIQSLRKTIEKLNDEIKEKDEIISSLEESNSNRAQQIKDLKDQAKSAFVITHQESNEKITTITNELYTDIKAKLSNIEKQQNDASKMTERMSHLNDMTNKLSNDIQILFNTNIKTLFENSSNGHVLLIKSVSEILSKTLGIYNDDTNIIQDFNRITEFFKEKTSHIFKNIFHFTRNGMNSSSPHLNKEIKEKLLHLVSVFLFGYLDAYSSLQISLQLNFKSNTQNSILKNINLILIEIVDELLRTNIVLSQRYNKIETEYLRRICNKKRNSDVSIGEPINPSNFQRNQVKIMTCVNSKEQNVFKTIRERFDLNNVKRNTHNNNLDDSINSNNHDEQQKIENVNQGLKYQMSLPNQARLDNNNSSAFLKKQDKKRSKLTIMREYIIKTIQQTDNYKNELNNLKDSLIHTIKSIKKQVLDELSKNGLIPLKKHYPKKKSSDNSIQSWFNINHLIDQDNETCKLKRNVTMPKKQMINEVKKRSERTKKKKKSDSSLSVDSSEKKYLMTDKNEIYHNERKHVSRNQMKETEMKNHTHCNDVKIHRNIESIVNDYLETGTATRKFDGIGISIEGSMVKCLFKNGLSASNTMKKISMIKINNHKGDLSRLSLEDDYSQKHI